MDLEAIYETVERRDIENTTGPQSQSHGQDEGKDLKHRGSRCLGLITVGLGLISVLLVVFNMLQHITITTERDLTNNYKNTLEEFNQTIKSLQDNYTDLMTKKHQLQNNFSSLSQKNLEQETRVRDLTAKKTQLQRNVDSLSQKNLEQENRVRDLTAAKTQLQRNVESLSQKKQDLETRVASLSWFFMSTELSWSASRQYCKNHGADLVIINTEEKQRFISSLVSERVWIGLSDTENEGTMKWVDNSALKQGFWIKGEPNNYGGTEDCIELNYNRMQKEWSPLKSWNDISCSETKKGICEK
ncbi:CD209 antigen-like protein C [Carassius auratus]|uniref:CD209 antigen-like protein C n=1 Tax=Carassius auratus TaxID=7957 RepID=A0A6P6NX10_CARAU|nr:CD209 antigen-like protein C [Carassius auratus]